MIDAFIDVNLELLADELATVPDPARFALEVSRETAEHKCDVAGARLRTDRPPEVVIGRGINAVTGESTVMVASRWAVVAPEHVVPAHRGGGHL